MPVVVWTASARIISEITLTQYVNKTVIIESTSDIFSFTSIIRTIIQTFVLVRVFKKRSALTEVSQKYSSYMQPGSWLVLSSPADFNASAESNAIL